jgi:hypothetical protein
MRGSQESIYSTGIILDWNCVRHHLRLNSPAGGPPFERVRTSITRCLSPIGHEIERYHHCDLPLLLMHSCPASLHLRMPHALQTAQGTGTRNTCPCVRSNLKVPIPSFELSFFACKIYYFMVIWLRKSSTDCEVRTCATWRQSGEEATQEEASPSPLASLIPYFPPSQTKV